MIDIKDCYFHSINLDGAGTLIVFDKILKDGKILSLEKTSFSSSKYRMNKSDEICLSKKNRYSIFHESAYDIYVKSCLSFILRGDLPGVYKPELIPIKGDGMRYLDSGKTDLVGEYRIKDEISLDDVIGINIPFNGLINNLGEYKWFFLGVDESFKGKLNHNKKTRIKNVMMFYDKVNECLGNYHLSIPIYDLEAGVLIREKNDIVKMKIR